MVVHLRPKQTCQKLTQSLKFERIDVLAQKLVIMTALESYRINDTPKNYKVKGADSLMRHHLKCVVITRIRAKPETRADRWIADALITEVENSELHPTHGGKDRNCSLYYPDTALTCSNRFLISAPFSASLVLGVVSNHDSHENFEGRSLCYGP